MPDDDHASAAEVLEGHVSRFPRPSEAWLLRLAVALAVVAAVAIGTAIHYRFESFAGGGLRVADPARHGTPGRVAVIHGTAGAQRSVVIVAQLAGLTPGHRCELIGNQILVGAFASGAVMPFQGGHGPCSL